MPTRDLFPPLQSAQVQQHAGVPGSTAAANATAGTDRLFHLLFFSQHNSSCMLIILSVILILMQSNEKFYLGGYLSEARNPLHDVKSTHTVVSFFELLYLMKFKLISDSDKMHFHDH